MSEVSTSEDTDARRYRLYSVLVDRPGAWDIGTACYFLHSGLSPGTSVDYRWLVRPAETGVIFMLNDPNLGEETTPGLSAVVARIYKCHSAQP